MRHDFSIFHIQQGEGDTGIALSFHQQEGDQGNDDTGKCVLYFVGGIILLQEDISPGIFGEFCFVVHDDVAVLVPAAYDHLPEVGYFQRPVQDHFIRYRVYDREPFGIKKLELE